MNSLALSADIFVLAGSILQAGGKFWVRRLEKKSDVAMPFGGRMDLRTTRDNLDILSFLSIGAGSVYFIFNDSDVVGSSWPLLVLCLAESLLLVAVGFESFAVKGENTFGKLEWPLWSWHPGAFPWLIGLSVAIASLVSMLTIFGMIDRVGSLPLLLVSFFLAWFIARSFGWRQNTSTHPLPARRKTSG